MAKYSVSTLTGFGRAAGGKRVVAVRERAGWSRGEQQRAARQLFALPALLDLGAHVGAGEQRVLAGDGAGGIVAGVPWVDFFPDFRALIETGPPRATSSLLRFASRERRKPSFEASSLGAATVADGCTEADQASDRDAPAGRE